MSSITIEILILLLLIIANGVFAMSEMAIISSRKARLQQLVNQGDAKARVALDLANTPNRILSTVQIGITLIGIFAGAFGGATLAEKLATALDKVPFLAAYSDALGFGIVVLSITYLSLVIGELVPKRLALNSPEKIALTVAMPMRVLSAIASPAVHLLSYSTEVILKLLGTGPSTEPEVTEEEIKVLIEQGTEAGTFEEAEQDMVERVFRLGDLQVSALMTPRPEIVWLDLEDSAEINQQKIVESGHSRLPVCQSGLDNVLGVVQVTDLLAQTIAGRPIDLTSSLKRPLFVPESSRGLKVLELLKQSGTHTVLVVDEYGVIQGLVTVNDILVELVGDISPGDDPDGPQAVQREDGSWLVDGMLSVEDFFDLFGLEEFSEEQKGNYHTMGGFMITHLGRIPLAADHFELSGFRFEVMDMDGNRVDKVLVMAVPKNSADTKNEK